jgi:hypothetical protein
MRKEHVPANVHAGGRHALGVGNATCTKDYNLERTIHSGTVTQHSKARKKNYNKSSTLRTNPIYEVF